MLSFYASLCLLSLGIAAVFWIRGATLVMPFASGAMRRWAPRCCWLCAPMRATAKAIACSQLSLGPWSSCVRGAASIAPSLHRAWVRVEPEHGDGSLVELSGQGQRIAVGRFVRPELRRQLAEELRWALRRWQAAA